MLHKKSGFESCTGTLEEETREGEYRITDQEAVRCALSIPEEFVPTPHIEFINNLQKEVEEESNNRIKERPTMTTHSIITKPSLQNGGEEGEGEYKMIGISAKTLLVRERERKLRSAFAKYKKWDENERCKIDKLDNNKVLVNDELLLDVDHSNYIKEEDVVLELDEDWRTCSMPPLPDIPPAPVLDDVECVDVSCRLGCICDSIKSDAVVRSHCGKPRCFFECTCQLSMFSNGDDRDIRSRLRPRVSLLNWKFMESAERDKEPPPVNYRQLERGVTVYPRMRRVAVAPQRFRNEYIMSSKFKDTFGRERRSSVAGISKFIRKTPTSGVKRDAAGSIYRRSFLVKSANKSKNASMSGKMDKCRPCTVSIDPLAEESGDTEGEEMEELVQEPLEIPNLIKMIERDGQIVLMGTEELCYVNFTLQWKHPRALVYEKIEGDILHIPWLYLPFPTAGETWLFHPIGDKVTETMFTYIPEINCVIPSKALDMHLKASTTQVKTSALSMLWVGQDSKERSGTIYILPALPNVLICGPFPRHQIKTRFNPYFNKLDRSFNVSSYLDEVNYSRSLGDEQSWNTFDSNKMEAVNATLKENVNILDKEINKVNDKIPAEVLQSTVINTFKPKLPPLQPRPSLPSSLTIQAVKPPKKLEPLKLSWNDAMKFSTLNQVNYFNPY